MIYSKFNKYIHDKFFSEENFGENIIMSVDDFDVTNFCTENKIEKEEFQNVIRGNFSRDWSLAQTINKADNIPNLFGLIAIQIYIASLMNEDNDYSASEYNPRIANYLDISVNSLQLLYSKWQDKIWHELNLWSNSNNIFLSIPQMGTGKGRYIQYPLSQALLNKEDLKKVPLLFQNVGIKYFETLSFIEFKYLILNSDNGNLLTSHYYRTKKRLEEENQSDLLYTQLYSFFSMEWDGEYCFSNQDKLNCKTTRIRKIENCNLLLDWENREIQINDNNEDDDVIKTVLLTENELFKKIKKYLIYSKERLIIFVKDIYYDTWNQNRYIERNKPCIIICEKYNNASKLIHRLDNNHINHSNSQYEIYEVNVNELITHTFWARFFSKDQKNYHFENGLKLSHNSWLMNAGPDIIFDNDVFAWLNGNRIILTQSNLIYSLRNFDIGIYRLKVKDKSPVTIEIVDSKNSCISEIQIGWNISLDKSYWRVVYDDYQILGLHTAFHENEEEANVRTWINANSEKPNKIQNKSTTINALKRAKNGI